MDYHRTYVSVRADFDEEGGILPRSLTLRDRVFSIDRVLCRRPAPARIKRADGASQLELGL